MGIAELDAVSDMLFDFTSPTGIQETLEYERTSVSFIIEIIP